MNFGIYGTGYAAFTTYTFNLFMMIYFTNKDDILR